MKLTNKKIGLISPALFIFIALLLQLCSLSLIVSLFFALLAAIFPFVLKSILEKRYKNAFEKELQDNLPIFSAALQAGHTLQKCLQLAAKRGQGPFAKEIGSIYWRWQNGDKVEELLQQSRDRHTSREYRLFCSAILLSRQAGCGLSKIFNEITTILAERRLLREKTAALTSQAKAQATLASCLTPAIFLALYLLQPDYMQPLLETFVGKMILLLVITMLLCGAWLINRLARSPGDD